MAHVGVELRDDLDLDDGAGETVSVNAAYGLPAFDDLRYPLLRLIDPYGDTIFSSYQMVGLVEELQARRKETGNDSLLEVISAAERCRSKARSWLVFIGD